MNAQLKAAVEQHRPLPGTIKKSHLTARHCDLFVNAMSEGGGVFNANFQKLVIHFHFMNLI